MTRLPALGLLCLLLVGCGTPQQRCISGVTRDLRVVERLIEQTQADLARGYTLVDQIIYVPVWDYCTRPYLMRTASGAEPVLVPGQMCLDDEPRTVRRPAAIDPAAEQRKLAGLQEQRRKLTAQAEPAVAQCRARYPS